MAFSLNLHTGYTGMVNFGVIFFVGVSAITVCVLTAPKEMNGYGWDILPAALVAITLSACFGWSLAYPTARLRTDYFAIVTISLGEIVKLLLSAEPILRTGPTKSAIGLGSYPLPLKNWWFCGSGVETGPNMEFASANACMSSTYSLSSPSERVSEILRLGEPAPYSFLLAIVSLTSVILVWILLQRLLSSPWGRILKAIREDEEVAQHHGHDVLRNKAASLALGAAIAGLAGVLWAWKLTGISPAFMSPASTTFLVWAAFIIGGSANNKGMIIGAMIIVMMEYVFNVLVVASSPDLPLYETANKIDGGFIWFVTQQWEVTAAFVSIAFIGILFRGSRISEFGFWGALVFAFTALLMQGERSLASATNYAGEVTISGAGMSYIKLVLIGSLMLFSLKYNPKGMLPEVPMRPERPNRGDSQ
jgi:neutral amino acid transport system permease protein